MFCFEKTLSQSPSQRLQHRRDCVRSEVKQIYPVSVPRWAGGTGSRIVARLPNLAGPQIVARPLLAVLLTHCGQLILSKIGKDVRF